MVDVDVTEPTEFEDNTWYPIETTPPPTDDSDFLVGMWDGPGIYDEAQQKFFFTGEPTWLSEVTHHENPSSKKYVSRGWNHRNGALGGRATHWAKTLAPPPLPDNILLQSTRSE